MTRRWLRGLDSLPVEEAMVEAPRCAVEQASLLGLERGVGALDVDVELGGPANAGTALGKFTLGSLGHHGLVSHDMGDKIEQALRHPFLDDEVGFLDDDFLANVVEGHEYGVHP